MLACGPEPESPLADRMFVARGITEDGAPRALVPTTELELEFSDTEVVASAGCDALRGTYELDEDRFVVSDESKTMTPCSQDLHEQDEWYFAFLLSKPSFALDGHVLVLEGGGTRIEYLD